MLTVLQACMAVMASFRLVDLLLHDRIAEPVRKLMGGWYLFGCPKCLSVWCGALSTAAFVVFPWLNWPLACSWMYLAWKEYLRVRALAVRPIARNPYMEKAWELQIAKAQLQVETDRLQELVRARVR